MILAEQNGLSSGGAVFFENKDQFRSELKRRLNACSYAVSSESKVQTVSL